MSIPSFQEAISSSQFLIIGHRGILNHPTIPENTIEAFRWALGKGADGFEFDLRLIEKRKIVVFHDRNLRRLFGEDKNIRNLSLSRLKEYKFPNTTISEITIPILEDVFREFEKSCYYNLELKAFGILPYSLVYHVCQLVREYNVQRYVWISSFNPLVLFCSKTIDAYIPTAYLFSQYTVWEKFISRLPFVDLIHPENRLLPKLSLLEKIKKPIIFWGANTEEELRIIYDNKLPGVITDRIDLANKIKLNLK